MYTCGTNIIFSKRPVSESVVKKTLPHNGWLESAYNHLTCCEVITATMGSQEMVQVDTKTRRRRNENVICYTHCRTQQLVNK